MKDNQEKLIQHLIRFHILDYESCLQVLDTENTGDKVALSYVFRPLTKQKYIIKDKNGIVSILKKGKELFPNEAPLILESNDIGARIEVQYAMILYKEDTKILRMYPDVVMSERVTFYLYQS